MNIALVMGCARSGTSILGELIGSHPLACYKHEAHSVWRKAGPGENDSHRLTEEHATPKVVHKIRKRFEREKGDAALFVEKCPRSILRVPFIRAVFPEARIIHIVRDGRDVACSMLAGIGNGEWKHLKPPNWETLLRDEEGIIRCAKAWQTILDIGLSDLATVPHLLVKYEELVENPMAVARRTLDYLGLEEHAAVVEFCARIQDKTSNSYQPKKQLKWFRDDHSRRVGRWRENLDETDARAVQSLLDPMLARLGYV